jgi:hypothetical protein
VQDFYRRYTSREKSGKSTPHAEPPTNNVTATTFSYLHPSMKTPNVLKKPLHTFANRSKVINSLFYHKALTASLRTTISAEQQTLCEYFQVTSVEQMEAKLSSFLEESGEGGEVLLRRLAPSFYKQLHLER